MSETDRVQRWRETKRQKGLKACTIWLTEDEELELKDLAAKGLCSPSTIMQRALAQYQPAKQSSSSNGADTEQLRALIQAELAQAPPVTALVTDTITATLARDLPALVRTIVEGLALEAFGLTATDTGNSYETDTGTPEETQEALHANITDTNGNVTEIEAPAAAPTRPAAKKPATPVPTSAQNGTAQPPSPRKPGRPTTLRPRILELLQARPSGLSALEIKVHLGISKNIGDTLSGMVRNHLIEKQGTGAQVRYRVGGAPKAPPAPPARRTTRKAQRV